MPDAQSSLDLLPLLFAFVLGGAIGLEREWHGRPAGLRTHILVCMSATMLIVVSRELALDQEPGAGRVVFDPNRMGAGIVTGIGFLGAGTVLRSGDFLRGLATAACIWFVAGLGIVLGSHHYALGVVSTLMVLFVLVGVNRLDEWIHPILYRRLIVQAGAADTVALVAAIRGELLQLDIRILDVASGHFAAERRCELVFYLSVKQQRYDAPAITERVAALPGVQSARWKQIA
jgi:putative Mg2+ transporter-C (MgtC) family protein